MVDDLNKNQMRMEINGLIRVDPIDPISSPQKHSIEFYKHSGKDQPEQEQQDEHEKSEGFSDDQFEQLARASEKANQFLRDEKTPFRFCIYRQNGQVHIDFVVLSHKGKIQKALTQNITHGNFYKWIENIESRRGVLLDTIK